MKLKKLFSALMGLTVLVGTANANLVSMDYVTGSGDGWITHDTVSGMDWLDVSLTAGQTFDQVRTGAWLQNGFRLASKAEVRELFAHAGTPDDGFDLSVTHPDATWALASLLGPTLSTGSRISVAGFVAEDYFGQTITLATHPLGEVFGLQLAKVDYLYPYGEAHFTGGQPMSNEADPYFGAFLVRAVPEPSDAILLLSGLGVFAAIRRRKI